MRVHGGVKCILVNKETWIKIFVSMTCFVEEGQTICREQKNCSMTYMGQISECFGQSKNSDIQHNKYPSNRQFSAQAIKKKYRLGLWEEAHT